MPPSSPTAADYDPFSPAVLDDPYPFYRVLRDEDPCHHVESRDIYVVSRYDDVWSVLRDHERFSSTAGVGYEHRPVPMMIASDPPEHTRLRRLVQRQFTPRAVAELRPRISSLVDALLGPVLDEREVDLVDALGVPLPTTVIAELMGVPASDRDDFKRWSDATIGALGGEQEHARRREMELAIVEFAEYFRAVIEERRHEQEAGHEHDDLISLLSGPMADGDRLSVPELVSFCILLIVAGNETTTNLIGNGTLALVGHPEEWAKVRSDRELVGPVVEEALRFDSPIQGFFRTPVADAEVAGTTIPAGMKTMVLYGSANRDERQFPDPDQFRADRDPRGHVAFGSGVHICLGAPLARLEARLLVEAALDRIATVELDGPVERTDNPLLRGVRRLPVRITPA